MHLKDSGEKIVTRLSGAGLCLRKNSVYCLTCSLPNFNAAAPPGMQGAPPALSELLLQTTVLISGEEHGVRAMQKEGS